MVLRLLDLLLGELLRCFAQQEPSDQSKPGVPYPI